MSRVCYLARPIDFAGTAKGWSRTVRHAAVLLADNGWLVYSPADAWWAGDNRPGPEIERINRLALESAGLVVAFLPDGVATVGVPMEIQRAIDLHIQVAVVGGEKSWALAGAGVEVFDKYVKFTDWLPKPGPASVPEDPMVRFLVGEGGTMPTRSHSGDAGWDLYSSEDVHVPPLKFVDVPTNVRVALPSGTWASVVGRSSTWRNWNLNAVSGVIDTGYRGELFSAVQNLSTIPVHIPAGTRLTQLILHTNLATWIPVRQVSEGEFSDIPSGDTRGTGGFGSTGVGTSSNS